MDKIILHLLVFAVNPLKSMDSCLTRTTDSQIVEITSSYLQQQTPFPGIFMLAVCLS